MKAIELGTYSDTEDTAELIQIFFKLLKKMSPAEAQFHRKNCGIYLKNKKDTWDEKEAQQVFDYLLSQINDHLPPGVYFGDHSGRYDYGFWLDLDYIHTIKDVFRANNRSAKEFEEHLFNELLAGVVGARPIILTGYPELLHFS